MNLIWLEDFLALASTGNFSRAAEDRHMTQPAFSRRIRALEEWLGVVLFDRTSHPATLTDTGLWFRNVAQEIVARIARVPDEARAVSDAASTTLKFAATHALSLTFLPPWLRSLESRVAVGPIQLLSDVLQQCETLMLAGRVQFVLCHAHALAPGRLDSEAFTSVKVGTDALLPVSAPRAASASLASLSSASPGAAAASTSALASSVADRDRDRDRDRAHAAPRHEAGRSGRAPVPALMYSPESGIGRILASVRGHAMEEMRLEPVFTAHLASVLRSMALEGRGVAWLPESLIGEDLRAGRLVEAAPEQWRVLLDVRLFRGTGTMARSAETFWNAVKAASLAADAAESDT